MSAALENDGAAWLGDVPAHWDLVPATALFAESKERAHEGDQMLSATQKYGVIPLAEFEEMEQRQVTKAIINLEMRKHVEVGDFVISMRSMDGGLERARAAGSVRSSYSVLRPGPEVEGRYFGALFKSSLYIQALRLTSNFIRDGQDLSFTHVRQVKLPKPGLEEQAVIADFLDRATARIDALVAKKTRFIQLLREKRESVIMRVVTKGVDEGVPMKDSRLDWLGNVPAHWKLAQLRRFTYSRCDGPFGSGLKSNNYTDGGVRVIRLQNIGSGVFKANNAAYIASEYWQDVLGGGHEVFSGDLLMAGLGDENNHLGRACVAPKGIEPALVKADCYRFRLTENVDAQYIALTLSATARHECGLLANGATRDRLNLGLAASRVIPVPPLAEQREIVSCIGRATARIDALIAKTECSIELLSEHRVALITAAVTGKLDPRNGAQRQ